MLPQMAHMGDGDGEFVFIPLQVPEHDIQVALRGGLDHALKGVYERALRRVAQRTRLEDVLDVFNAVDYRFSTKPREREKLWQEKFERFEENAEIDDELAMVALHYCYAKGLGTDKDQEKAYRWAMRAHEVGHGAGKHALAHCYAEGLGVGRNKAAADALLRDSAADFLLSKYRLHEERLWQLLSVPAGKKVPLDAKLSLGADERTRLLADLQAAADGGVEAARCGLAYLACYGIKGIIEARPNENLRLLEAEAHHRGSVLAHYYLACISWDGIPGVVTPDPQKLLLQAHGRRGGARPRSTAPGPSLSVRPRRAEELRRGTPVGRTGRQSREHRRSSHLGRDLFPRLGRTQGPQESRRICRAGRRGRQSEGHPLPRDPLLER